MRIAITGATGLLGGNLAAAATAAGHHVVATRRATSRVDHLADLDLEWHEASLGDAASLARAFAGMDAVIHCAASTSMLPRPTPALIAANVVGTEHVLQAVAEARVPRLVHTSSTVTVGIAEGDTPCTEAHAYNLAAHGLADGYAVTKRQSEEAVLLAAAAGLDAVVVNPGFLFGPRDARPSSGAMILEVAAGRARLASRGRNCFVDARDVANGILGALEHGRTGERYILGGHNLSYREIFTRIAAIVGAPAPLGIAPRPLAAVAGWVGDGVQAWTGREQGITSQTVRWGYTPGFVFSSAKAEAELGYTIGSIEDGIAAAWRWFAARGTGS